jgi:5,6-dimethylbenzimidazole synthase
LRAEGDLATEHTGRFSDAERAAVYRAIFERRDVRAEFVADPIPDDVFARVLDAAHHAPSVGFMQPTRFIVVRERATRERVHAAFARANALASQTYAGDERAAYDALKLAGILEAPLNVCVLCETETPRGRGLGRQTMPETALYSSVCAVQNFWLAARAEGVGVGWVSIVDPSDLRAILGVPDRIAIVAYLCVGYVRSFNETPDLERARWESRAKLDEFVFAERYGERRALFAQGPALAPPKR